MSAPSTEEVEGVLTEYVRPLLNAEGGDVRLERVGVDGTVAVCFLGRCAGCPGADITLSAMVEPFVIDKLPNVKKVVAVTWHLPTEGTSTDQDAISTIDFEPTIELESQDKLGESEGDDADVADEPSDDETESEAEASEDDEEEKDAPSKDDDETSS